MARTMEKVEKMYEYTIVTTIENAETKKLKKTLEQAIERKIARDESKIAKMEANLAKWGNILADRDAKRRSKIAGTPIAVEESSTEEIVEEVAEEVAE